MNKTKKQGSENNAEGNDANKTNLVSAMTGTPGERGQGKMPKNGQRGASLENMAFSGEIIDIMIPVGSAINQMSDPSLELSYKNLKKGMVIRIQVDQEMTDEFSIESDSKTIYADTLLIME